MSAPLVLLHGFTGSPASWDPVVARLEPGTRVIAPPLLGHEPADPGASPADAPERDAATFEEEVFALFAHVWALTDGAPCHLAGYSLGARLALMMLVTAPEKFLSATLIGVNPGLATDAERERRRAADQRWIDLLERGIEAFVDEWERLPLWSTQRRLPPDVLADQRAARLRHDPRGLQRSLRVTGLTGMPDLRPHLARVSTHVDLMVGAEDPKFVTLAQETAALLPDARVVVVPDAGHNLLLERPRAVADELNRKIR